MAGSLKKKFKTILVVDATVLRMGEAPNPRQTGTTVREWLDIIRAGTRENGITFGGPSAGSVFRRRASEPVQVVGQGTKY